MNYLLAVPLALLGWLAGGLVNYLGDVLPNTRRLTPALCAQCQAPIPWGNYLLLRPCGCCGQRRGRRAWAVHLVLVILFVGFWFYPPSRITYWPGMILLTYFGVVTVIDLEHRLILHPTSLAGALLTGAWGLWKHGWQSTLFGLLAGFGIMYGLVLLGAGFAWLLGKLRGQKIEEDAMGFGDATLGGVLGLLMGWPAIGAGLIIAILLGGAGSIVVVIRQVFKRQYSAFQAIPYGPFMVAAAFLLLYILPELPVN